MLALHVLQARLCISRLPLVIIVHDLNVAQIQLHSPIGFPHSRDLLLQRVLRMVCFCLRLLVFRLPFLSFITQLLDLFPQLPLGLLRVLDIPLELLF